jgi:hypothetical protein
MPMILTMVRCYLPSSRFVLALVSWLPARSRFSWFCCPLQPG